ncbi:MAG: porin [Bacteroidales bacterium]
MPTKKNYRHSYTGRKRLTNIFMFVLLVLIIQPSWAQNDVEPSDSSDQSSYPDFQPAGFLQTHFSADDKADNPSGFSIHRARFGFTGNISKNIRLSLIAGAVEPPENTPALVNAFAGFTIHPLFNLRIGQFLVPFGLEGPEAIIKNPAIERAFSTRRMNRFRMFRDIGMMAYGKHSFVNYSVAVVNGNGANVTEKLDQKDVLGRLDFTLTEGLISGFSGHLGTLKDTTGRLSQQRWAAHVEYKNNPLHLRGEIILHDQEIVPESWKHSAGGYLLSNYKIADKWEAIGRYDYLKPHARENIYQGVTLGTNYLLSGLSRLSVNGTAYTKDDGNTIHYMLNVQMQLVL